MPGFAGPAVTVKPTPASPGNGQSRVHLGARAISQSRPGGVIVVDNGGRTEMGASGGLLFLAAARDGVAASCSTARAATWTRRGAGLPGVAAVRRPAHRETRVFEESTGTGEHRRDTCASG